MDAAIGRSIKVARAEEAWEQLKKGRTLKHWLAIAQAMQEGRQIAMREAEANRPVGKGYNIVFHRWLNSTTLHEIDEKTRRCLFEIIDHLDEVVAWHAALPPDRQIKINHPQTVWLAFRRAIPPKRNTERAARLEEVISEDYNTNARRWAQQWEQLMVETGKTPAEVVALCRASTERTIEEFLRNHPVPKWTSKQP